MPATASRPYFAQPRVEEAVIGTPELSFVIGRLGAAGGINLSASHNPPDDNGIKVYDAFGSQPVAPEDQALMDAMREATAIRSKPFAQALAEGLVRSIPEDLHQDYLAAYLELYGDTFTPRSDLPLVYTPLCGCGLKTVGDLLVRLNFPVRTPPGQDADGSFSVIPFKAPNPEVPQATGPAREFADEIGSGLVLSSDPDADRVGLEVKAGRRLLGASGREPDCRRSGIFSDAGSRGAPQERPGGRNTGDHPHPGQNRGESGRFADHRRPAGGLQICRACAEVPGADREVRPGGCQARRIWCWPPRKATG